LGWGGVKRAHESLEKRRGSSLGFSLLVRKGGPKKKNGPKRRENKQGRRERKAGV